MKSGRRDCQRNNSQNRFHASNGYSLQSELHHEVPDKALIEKIWQELLYRDRRILVTRLRIYDFNRNWKVEKYFDEVPFD